MTPKKELLTASDEELFDLASAVVKKLEAKQQTVSVAESCTGGLLAKRLTDIPGSSAVFPGGVVAYQNEIKMGLLGVSEKIIETETEVSAECAKAMADGAAARFATDYALSTTGYAGPGGGTKEHPVGTVYLGFHTPEKTTTLCIFCPNATRSDVRVAAAKTALSMLLLELGIE